MATIKRRKRRRDIPPDSLLGYWSAGDKPPQWAYQPGEHTGELEDLVFFGADEGPFQGSQEHPHQSEWWKAYEAAGDGGGG